eukprot:3378255-Rhodomonas_salina.3
MKEHSRGARGLHRFSRVSRPTIFWLADSACLFLNSRTSSRVMFSNPVGLVLHDSPLMRLVWLETLAPDSPESRLDIFPFLKLTATCHEARTAEAACLTSELLGQVCGFAW